MSIFKTKGLVLKSTSFTEKEFLYDIFTYEYGRIKATRKIKTKEKSLDLGYIINFEIETKEWKNIHKIKNIKIKSEFSYEGKEFELISEYLILLGTIIKHIPESVQVREVFEVLEAVNEKKHMDSFKLLLARLKILDIVWILPDKKEASIKKILDYIRSHKIKDILKLTGASDETLITLKSIV